MSVYCDCAVDQADPYGQVAGQHFNELIRRYGSPIIVLDLVKVSGSMATVEQFLLQFCMFYISCCNSHT